MSATRWHIRVAVHDASAQRLAFAILPPGAAQCRLFHVGTPLVYERVSDRPVPELALRATDGTRLLDVSCRLDAPVAPMAVKAQSGRKVQR